MRKKFLISFLFFSSLNFIQHTCFAQVSSKYTFAYGTPGYAAIAGTTLGTSPMTDNAVYTAVPIGFTFGFNCIDYTTIGVSTNGFIWFGATNPATTEYTPISSATAYVGVVAGFAQNLISKGAGSKVSYTTTGSSPNRIFTVEWLNVRGAAGSTSRFDLQIKLFETTNAIRIQANDWAYAVSGTSTAQCGLRGSSNADFFNRRMISGSTNWCSSTTGTLNTHTSLIVAAFSCDYPPKDSGFDFTLTGSCCTTPATQPSAASVSPISFTTATLNWTAGSGTGGDIVFLKQGSAIGTDPTNTTVYTANSAFGSGSQIGATGAYAIFKGAGGTTPITNLLPGTTYYYAIYTFDAVGPCYKTPTTATGSFTTTACSFPSTQPSAVSILCSETPTTMSIQFTRGNGTNVIVLAKAGSNVDADPVYNTSYTANAAFGSGSQIGTGNYVVYDGNAAGTVRVDITGLTAGTTYYFKIYEYNASPNCYNTTAPATVNGYTKSAGSYTSSTTSQNSATVQQGALAQQVIGLTIVVGGGLEPAATINNIIFNTTGCTNAGTSLTNAKIFYTGASSTYASATQYGTTFTSFAGNLTATGNFALLTGTNYFWVAYDIKSTATIGNVVDATIVTVNITDNTGTSNRTPTVTAPAGSRSIVAAGAGAPPGACIPSPCLGTGVDYLNSIVLAGISYTANNSGGYLDATASSPLVCVIPGNSYTLTYYADDFIGNTNSAWIDWDRNGVFGNNVNEQITIDHASFAVSVTVNVPVGASIGATRMRISNRFPSAGSNPCVTSDGAFTGADLTDVTVTIAASCGGGGVSCATLAPTVTTPVNYAKGAAAVPLTATGTSLLWYTDPSGGVGSGVAPTPSTATAGTVNYYVSQTVNNPPVCEGPRTQISVVVTGPACPAACTAPTTQATSMTFTGTSTSAVTVNWVRGNGNSVLVIGKLGSAPTDPTSGTTYTGNSVFGSGSAVGGGFAVYNGTGTSVDVTNLLVGSTYYFAVYEYATIGTCYTIPPLSGNLTMPNCSKPTIQP